ncbi:MAG: methyltransferase domain-containing protein, partial [Alphaproteobacteria bacterium]|nr:methyltransferase domain-containing protein [Alphaproteobacteria bacterium]
MLFDCARRLNRFYCRNVWPSLARPFLAAEFGVCRIMWRNKLSASRIWLELGSGEKKGSGGWTTVDIRGADLAHDILRGIPLKDNSVERIYTSHTLEHFRFSDLVALLHECRRVLVEGGELSVCVPNARKYIDAYIQGAQFETENNMYAPAVTSTGSAMDQVNYIAYMHDQHRYLFDGEN